MAYYRLTLILLLVAFSARAQQSTTSGGGGGASATNVAFQVMTNFVLNTIYTNTSGGPEIISSLARTHTAAVNGDASIDLMVDQAGGTTFVPFGGIRIGTTVAVTLAMDYTNSISSVISNLASFYWTNSSSGAGNVGALIAGTASYTSLGAVTNFVSTGSVVAPGSNINTNGGTINLNATPVFDGSQVFLGANTNVSVSNILTAIIVTNVLWSSPTVIFSNSILDTASEPNPAFRPFGGTYYNLRITNSVSATNHSLACMGFPLNTTFPKGLVTIIRDSVFWSEGQEGDAVSWKAVDSGQAGASTNTSYFYNDIFHAGRFAFNQVGPGVFYFKGCDFESIAGGATDGSFGIGPDRGPVTNVIQDCRWKVADCALGVGLLNQVNSAQTLVGGYFDITTSNATHYASAIAFSGEGTNTVIIKNTHVHLAGPGTNALVDFHYAGATTAGNNCLLVLDNVTYDGVNSASGGWMIDNAGLATDPVIIVMGGNLSATNFTKPSSVTFLTAFQAGTNVWTGSNFWSAATNKYSGAVIANRFVGDGSALTALAGGAISSGSINTARLNGDANSAHYLDGTGAYTTPAGGSGPSAGTNISVSGTAVSLQQVVTNLVLLWTTQLIQSNSTAASSAATFLTNGGAYFPSNVVVGGSFSVLSGNQITVSNLLNNGWFSNAFGFTNTGTALFQDSAGASVVITNGVIGIMKAATNSGNIQSQTFNATSSINGPGTGLTSLPANQLSSGTVPTARLTYTLATNTLNTGIGAVGQVNTTNAAGAVTLGGFSGLVASEWNTVIWIVTASGADRTITDPANVFSDDGTRSSVATNGLKSIITYGILPGVYTNRVKRTFF